MKKILILVLFLVSSLTVMFGMGFLRYQILKPAENPLPKDVNTILFAYRNISFEADSMANYYKYNEEVFLDTTDYRKEIANSAYMGFVSVMSKHYASDTIPFLMLEETKGNEAREVPLLSWKKVNELCRKFGSDVLVSLDDVVIFNNYGMWYDGQEYNGLADIVTFHSWTVYDPLLEKYPFKESLLDSLQVHETSYNIDYLIEKKLPQREDIMKTVAFSLGENLAKKFVPHWVTVYREYYDKGNRAMKYAAQKVVAEEWEEALRIWSEIQENGEGKYRARAAFNRAIVYERIGEIRKALDAIQQSIDIYKELGKYHKELASAESIQSILEQRLLEIQSLKN